MPKRYTDEERKRIQGEICSRLTRGESLTSICESDGIPHLQTVYDWIDEDNDFGRDYDLARIRSADTFIDKILDLPKKHNGNAGMLRAELESLKWVASKLNPRKYGERLEISNANQFVPLDKLVEIAHKSKNFSTLPDRDFKQADVLRLLDTPE